MWRIWRRRTKKDIKKDVIKAEEKSKEKVKKTELLNPVKFSEKERVFILLLSLIKEVSLSVIDIFKFLEGYSITFKNMVKEIEGLEKRLREILEAWKEEVGMAAEGVERMKFVSEIERKIEEVNGLINSISNTVGDLFRQSEEVRKIVTIVDGISGKTKLLALNAMIESARAGAHGKSFAVVAEEVKKLAEETEHSAKNITTVIQKTDSLIESVKDAIDTIQQETLNFFSETKEKIRELDQVIINTVQNLEATLKEITSYLASSIEASKGILLEPEEIKKLSAYMNEMMKKLEDYSEQANKLIERES